MELVGRPAGEVVPGRTAEGVGGTWGWGSQWAGLPQVLAMDQSAPRHCLQQQTCVVERMYDHG